MLILQSIIFAQEWVARYDGPGSWWDYAYAIAVDDAGNAYVTGFSEGWFTHWDYATIKYDSLGVEQWVARYNGPGNYRDEAMDIAIDNAGNVYVTGTSTGGGTYCDYATIKYDSAGVEQWVARYDGGISDNDLAFAIAIDDSCNIYVAGRSMGSGTYFDYVTVKYDASGMEQWVERYNGPGNGFDQPYDIAVDGAGNVYVTGKSPGIGGDRDYATVKYNSAGVKQWVARYDGPASDNDVAKALVIDNVCAIYVTGSSRGSATDKDYATIKYDSSGTQQWVSRYNGPVDLNDYARAIAIDSAGSIYVTGGSTGVGTRQDITTVKYDSAGVEQWVARYDGPSSVSDEGAGIATDHEGNICVTGPSDGLWTGTDYATVKYDSAGLEQWVARYDGPNNYDDYSFAIAIHNGGSVYVTGRSEGIVTNQDYATIKYSPTGLMENKNTNVKKEFLMTTIFRGPLQLPEDKKCKVFDIAGRIVKPDRIQTGIYFIEIDGVVTQKVIKIR
jgi:hypothetical protein